MSETLSGAERGGCASPDKRTENEDLRETLSGKAPKNGTKGDDQVNTLY